jgi:hypothetical protein
MFSSNPILIAIKSKKLEYDANNDKHNAFITESIRQFKADMLKIQTVDGGGVLVIIAALGYINPPAALLACAGLYLYRQSDAQKAQDSLNDLICIYHWASAKGPETTLNPFVMELARAVAPYVKTEVLFPPHLYSTTHWITSLFSDEECKFKPEPSSRRSSGFLSMPFTELLLASPHYQILAQIKEDSSLVNFFKSSEEMRAQTRAIVQRAEVQKKAEVEAKFKSADGSTKVTEIAKVVAIELRRTMYGKP